MSEPATALEAAAIQWAAALVAACVPFQAAIGAADATAAALKIYETDATADYGSHAVVEVDSGDLRRDGDAMQGTIQVAITLMLAPATGMNQTDALRRMRNVAAAVRAQFSPLRHVLGVTWQGPSRLPKSCPWPEWFGAALTIRVLGSE